MDYNEELFYKIENYLKGNCSSKETQLFEEQIANDTELAEMVEMHRFEQIAKEYLIEQELRDTMSKWKEETPPSNIGKKKGGNSAVKWWLGLVVLVLVGSLFFYMRGKYKPSETPLNEQEPANNDPAVPIAAEEITAPKKNPESKKKEEVIVENKNNNQQNEPPPSQPEPNNSAYLAYAETAYTIPEYLKNARRIEDENQQATALTKGTQAFKDGDYKMAVKELESISSEIALYENARETLAHAYFKNGQFGKAADLFQIIVKKSRFNKDEPEWYLLLSYVANYADKKSEADALLEKISRDELHNYQQGALQLKAKIKSMEN